jgi:hypothetical protein
LKEEFEDTKEVIGIRKSKKNLNFWCLTPLSAISWRPVLVVEEAGVPGENH